MSDHTTKRLASLGYSYDTPSFQEVIDHDSPKRIYAYCTWHECARGKSAAYKPHAKLQSRRCPDCGHELTWRQAVRQQDIDRGFLE